MIFDQVSNQIRGVVNQEVASAKAEVTARAKRDGLGMGLIAGAAIVVLLGLAALTFAAIAALATAFATWLAALIVAVVYMVIAIGLASAGKRQLKKGGAPLPKDTMRDFKADVRRRRANGKADSAAPMV